jgi:hypothetical protein
LIVGLEFERGEATGSSELQASGKVHCHGPVKVHGRAELGQQMVDGRPGLVAEASFDRFSRGNDLTNLHLAHQEKPALPHRDHINEIPDFNASLEEGIAWGVNKRPALEVQNVVIVITSILFPVMREIACRCALSFPGELV